MWVHGRRGVHLLRPLCKQTLHYLAPKQTPLLHNRIVLVWSWCYDCNCCTASGSHWRYLACWNPSVSSIHLKPLQSSETPELLCSLSIIMSLCVSRWALSLSCFTGERGDVSPLHYWHTLVSLRHSAFQHKRMLSARHEWDFGLWQRRELKAIEALGNFLIPHHYGYISDL